MIDTFVAVIATLIAVLILCVSFAFGRTSVVDDCRDYSAAVIGTIRLDCKVANNG